jgi:hypothetical protein
MSFATERSFKLKLIEFLNAFRAKVLGIGFGDQVQFCKRQIALNHHLMYRAPLMEDVFFSLRLKEISTPLILSKVTEVSPRKWKKAPYTKSVITVFWIVFVFCVSYRLGLLNAKSRYYTRKYYGEEKQG